MASYIQHVETFNSNLRQLTRDLARRCTGDVIIDRAQKRVMLVSGVDPLFTINAVGPYLYRYREQIYALDDASESFFLDNPFDVELRESVNPAKADVVSHIIPRAKEVARTLPPPEKQAYRELIINLLDDYIEFLGSAPKSALGGTALIQ